MKVAQIQPTAQIKQPIIKRIKKALVKPFANLKNLVCDVFEYQKPKYVIVNGKKVNIPSYLVKAGDVIAVREIKKDSKIIKENAEVNSSKPIPEWLEKDNEKLNAKVIRLASRADVDLPVEEHLIVELYSK